MKQLQFILFSILIASSVYVHVTQQADDKSDEKVTLNSSKKKEEFVDQKIDDVKKDSSITKESQPDNIIFFITQDDEDNNKPSGQYWPAQDIFVEDVSLHSKAASAFIADDSYSNVIEEKKLIPEKQSHYLGYFTHPKTEEIIYLYGTKDKKDKPDHTDEDINSGNQDEVDDDDNQEENN